MPTCEWMAKTLPTYWCVATRLVQTASHGHWQWVCSLMAVSVYTSCQSFRIHYSIHGHHATTWVQIQAVTLECAHPSYITIWCNWLHQQRLRLVELIARWSAYISAILFHTCTCVFTVQSTSQSFLVRAGGKGRTRKHCSISQPWLLLLFLWVVRSGTHAFVKLLLIASVLSEMQPNLLKLMKRAYAV